MTIERSGDRKVTRRSLLAGGAGLVSLVAIGAAIRSAGASESSTKKQITPTVNPSHNLGAIETPKAQITTSSPRSSQSHLITETPLTFPKTTTRTAQADIPIIDYTKPRLTEYTKYPKPGIYSGDVQFTLINVAMQGHDVGLANIRNGIAGDVVKPLALGGLNLHTYFWGRGGVVDIANGYITVSPYTNYSLSDTRFADEIYSKAVSKYSAQGWGPATRQIFNICPDPDTDIADIQKYIRFYGSPGKFMTFISTDVTCEQMPRAAQEIIAHELGHVFLSTLLP